ncbi:MAG: hypothetical protein QXO20_05135 [Candidatus Bathyarchaeia archaeon]
MDFRRERVLVPVSVPCYNWVDEDGNSGKRTVIISPVRIIECEDGSIQISWACSRGVLCRYKHCRYSHQTKIRRTIGV